MNGTGILHSLEGSPDVAELAKETLNTLNLNNTIIHIGPFQKTLSEVLHISKPVDFLFNDGHHDYNAVIDYFEKSLPFLAEESVMVFDDISWSEGMRKAWEEIVNHKSVYFSINLLTIGIVVINPKLKKKKKLEVQLFK